MNCDDYLSMLATVPVEELAYGRAREHAKGCRDCDRVTRVVAERERNMLVAYGDIHSSSPVEQITANAIRATRRRTVARYRRIGIGVAVAATVLSALIMHIFPAPLPGVRNIETFRLQCLSPEQAMELLRPALSTTGMIWARSNLPLGVVNVEASPGQMAQARALLDRYDNAASSQCAVQVRVPKVPATP